MKTLSSAMLAVSILNLWLWPPFIYNVYFCKQAEGPWFDTELIEVLLPSQPVSAVSLPNHNWQLDRLSPLSS